MKKSALVSLLSLSALAFTTTVSAGVVIVNANNSSTITEADVSRIFLGKLKSFSNGTEAIPVDQAEGSPMRAEFVSSVLKKNDQQMKAYWAQLLFTGKGTPPKEMTSGADVKKLVAENPALIGYVDKGDVDASVKVVLEF